MALPAPFSTIMSAMHRPIYNARLRELVRCISPHLERDDRILDVGCGVGTLAKALIDAPNAPQGLVAEGLERVVRGGEPITVHAYDGGTMPFEDDTFDIVIVADVLHHEPNPDQLIAECARVSRRLVIIKDHQVQGVAAQQRISFMDWAANAPYGVPCLYRYNTPSGWTDALTKHHLDPVERFDTMKLYPPIVNTIFGGQLQFMTIARVAEATGVEADLTPPDQSFSAEANP
jgi:SAM-dependent methyltransferase